MDYRGIPQRIAPLVATLAPSEKPHGEAVLYAARQLVRANAAGIDGGRAPLMDEEQVRRALADATAAFRVTSPKAQPVARLLDAVIANLDGQTNNFRHAITACDELLVRRKL